MSLAIRIDSANPNHHLWLNNGTWWCHYTVHLPQNRAQRVRRTLSTGSRDEARRRRDDLFARLSAGSAIALEQLQGGAA